MLVKAIKIFLKKKNEKRRYCRECYKHFSEDEKKNTSRV